MIGVVTGVPPGVVALRASDTLIRAEYDTVVVPLLDDAPEPISAQLGDRPVSETM